MSTEGYGSLRDTKFGHLTVGHVMEPDVQSGQKNDAATAMNYYEKSISLNPTFAESHKAMGMIHFKGGEKQRAKKYFESCLLLSPNTADKAYIQGYLKSCATNGEG